MTVIANIILGSDGSTALEGSSRALTDATDRERFHKIRSGIDAILIGGNTARHEPYGKTPVPVLIVSKRNEIPALVRANPLASVWNLSPMAALQKATTDFGQNILIESGPTFLLELLREGAVDELFITISPKTGGEARIQIGELTNGFIETSREEVSGTIFLKFLKN